MRDYSLWTKKNMISKGTTYDIFISYSTQDIETAKKVATYLLQIQGVSVFISDSSLIVGMLSNELVEKIKHCDLFIVLYSKNSLIVKFLNNRKLVF